MDIFKKIQLLYRANKYKFKNDKGGIAFIINSVKEGHTALDIGAHKAGYLYFMIKQTGNSGKVIAFEPQTNLYQYITEMKKLFNWNNVTIEQLAFSDSDGTVTLFIPVKKAWKNSSPGATIVEQKFDSSIGFTENVTSKTLDAYCNKHNIKPDFLKIDVEGNELKVLQGGAYTLKKYKPNILVEIEARHIGQDQVIETLDFLKSLSYKGHFIHGPNRIPLNQFNFNKYQNLNDKKNYCNNFTFE